ncbi:hypothetical protein JQ635_19530 [Bradyrhizobium iriomotense]|nr:hypothetical protein [Bradyrhizobium iriomotense]
MLSMGSEQSPQLPYLGHNGRELGLMLRGTKPLAYFLNSVRCEFDVNIRYWRMFDRHVAAGRLIGCEVFEVIDDLPYRRLLYALPGHAWRIDAMLMLLKELEAWTEDHERRSCELLGYEGWQIDYWLAHRRSRSDA